MVAWPLSGLAPIHLSKCDVLSMLRPSPWPSITVAVCNENNLRCPPCAASQEVRPNHVKRREIGDQTGERATPDRRIYLKRERGIPGCQCTSRPTHDDGRPTCSTRTDPPRTQSIQILGIELDHVSAFTWSIRSQNLVCRSARARAHHDSCKAPRKFRRLSGVGERSCA